MPDFLAEVLTWPGNYEYAIAVETAKEWGVPPTLFILEDRKPNEGWTAYDKKLALAWTVLQKETCGICSQPLWICRSSNKNLTFSIRTDVCYASRDLEKFKKSQRGKNLKDGEYPYIVPKMYDDSRLPSRREWLEELAE